MRRGGRGGLRDGGRGRRCRGRRRRHDRGVALPGRRVDGDPGQQGGRDHPGGQGDQRATPPPGRLGRRWWRRFRRAGRAAVAQPGVPLAVRGDGRTGRAAAGAGPGTGAPLSSAVRASRSRMASDRADGRLRGSSARQAATRSSSGTGRLPASISRSTTPSEYTSAAAVVGPPLDLRRHVAGRPADHRGVGVEQQRGHAEIGDPDQGGVGAPYHQDVLRFEVEVHHTLHVRDGQRRGGLGGDPGGLGAGRLPPRSVR